MTEAWIKANAAFAPVVERIVCSQESVDQKLVLLQQAALEDTKKHGQTVDGEPTLASAVLEIIGTKRPSEKKLEMIKDSAELTAFASSVFLGKPAREPELFDKIERVAPGLTRDLRKGKHAKN